MAGAIAGRIIGKSTKATVIGGAAGAAAGAAAAAATANYQGCINAGGNIVVKLTAPATVRAALGDVRGTECGVSVRRAAGGVRRND